MSALRDAVSEKTGYPSDMIEDGMDLESDLGVDSIKRVEILAALKEQVPEIPEVDAAELGSLRTLDDIANYLRERTPLAAAQPSAVANGAPAPSVDLVSALRDAVSEKTGYPSDMIEDGMDLESDLGVDSIKRVEILAALKEQVPDIPEVDAAELGSLRTLADIASYLRERTPLAAAPQPSAAANGATAPSVDLVSALRDAVSEKTGYPSDMIEDGMDLESDLGVDSIKRVEILAALKEQVPDIPEVDAAELGSLRTLADIANYLRERSGAPAVASTAEASADVPAPQVSRYEVVAVAAPAAGFVTPGLLDAASVAITDDGGGVAAAMVEQLATLGIGASVVTEVPADADAVVSLDGLSASEDPDAAIAANRAAFRAARAVAKRFEGQGGAFITVQDTGGDFGLSGGERAYYGGIAGLAKTAAREWSSASVRAIDIERGGRKPEEVAAALVSELTDGGVETEVGLRADGERITLRSVETPVEPAEPALAEGDAVLASGGARGVTAAALIELVRRTRCRVALLGRTPLADEPASCAGASTAEAVQQALIQSGDGPKKPAELRRAVQSIMAVREIRATVAAMKEAGGDARYVVADVRDPAAMKAELDAVRLDWGSFRALVHGAGVLADKKIADKTDEQFDFVFNTKVDGLRALLEATENDELKAILLFSSIAGRCGNPGQSDYAMANEVLNKVAAAERVRRGDGVIVRSLGWGPWDGGMVTDALRSHFQSLGIPLIGIADGAARFADECASPGGATEVVIGGDPAAWVRSADVDEPRRFDVLVNRATHPYLDGHRPKGPVVVPVVLVAEWFARAARACRPDLTFAGCVDLSVLRGIELDDFDVDQRFRVEVQPAATNGRGPSLDLALLDEAGHPRYRARALMRDGGATEAPSAATPLGDLGPLKGPVYGDALFHGAEFQVIRDFEGISDRGAAAQLVGARGVGWPSEGWQTDPALLDGGLQLAVLWTQQRLGGSSLPLKVESLNLFQPGLADGDIRGQVTGREAKGDRAVSDVLLVDGKGEAVAELRGVETFVLPGTRKA